MGSNSNVAPLVTTTPMTKPLASSPSPQRGGGMGGAVLKGVSEWRKEWRTCRRLVVGHGVCIQYPCFKPLLVRTTQMKKVGAVGLAVVLSGIILVAGLPVVAHAASGTLADITAGASSSYNSVMAKLAASGFLQAFSLVFVSEIGDKTFFIAGAWLDWHDMREINSEAS